MKTNAVLKHIPFQYKCIASKLCMCMFSKYANPHTERD